MISREVSSNFYRKKSPATFPQPSHKKTALLDGSSGQFEAPMRIRDRHGDIEEMLGKALGPLPAAVLPLSPSRSYTGQLYGE